MIYLTSEYTLWFLSPPVPILAVHILGITNRVIPPLTPVYSVQPGHLIQDGPLGGWYGIDNTRWRHHMFVTNTGVVRFFKPLFMGLLVSGVVKFVWSMKRSVGFGFVIPFMLSSFVVEFV